MARRRSARRDRAPGCPRQGSLTRVIRELVHGHATVTVNPNDWSRKEFPATDLAGHSRLAGADEYRSARSDMCYL